MPKGMLSGQGLDTKNIQRRAGYMPTGHGCQQIVIDQVSTPRHIDHIGTRQQLRQRVTPQNAFCVGRQRQQADQNPRRSQKIGESRLT